MGKPNGSDGDEHGEGGFVLVAVLGIILILTILAWALIVASRDQIKARVAQLGHAELTAYADGMVRLTALRLAELQPVATQPPKLPLDGSPTFCTDGAIRVVIQVNDASGLVDINAVPQDILSVLLAGLDVPREDAARLATAIADFRDADDVAGVGGAESAAYADAGRTFGPKNGPFDSIDELDQVLGMTPQLLERLRPLVTVHSRTAAIDMTVAPISLLQALTRGRANSLTDRGFALPASRDQFQLPSQLTVRSNPRSISRSRSRTAYIIRVGAFSGRELAFARHAVIEITPRSPVGFTTREWKLEPLTSLMLPPPGAPAIACEAL